MFDVSVYAISLVRWLTGLKAESVSCITGNYFFAEHARNDVEDFGAMLTTLEGGVTASYVAGRYGWSSHASDGVQRLFLVGTEGTVMVDAHTPRIEVYNDEPNFQLPPLDPYDPMGMWGSTFETHPAIPKDRWLPLPAADDFGDEVSNFIDCIETGKRPEIDARAAAEVLEVILGGYVSAASGEVVSLPLPRQA